MIRQLKIGNITLENIEGSIVLSMHIKFRKQSLKTDWKTISDIMKKDQTVLATDVKNNKYKENILTSAT